MDAYDVLAAVRELVNDPPELDAVDWTDVDRYRAEVEAWYDRRPDVAR